MSQRGKIFFSVGYTRDVTDWMYMDCCECVCDRLLQIVVADEVHETLGKRNAISQVQLLLFNQLP